MSVIEMDKYRKKGKKYTLSTYDSYYECTFMKDYQHKYSQSQIQGIEIGGVYAIILKTNKGKYYFAAIHFFKGDFTLPESLDWLDKYGIILMEEGKEQQTIRNCERVIDIVPFKNNHLILYKKGTETLKLDYTQLNQGQQSEKIDRKTKIVLVLNGEKLDYIPRINFNKQRDVVVCNGNCVVADYIDEYNGNIGFFQDTNPALPISFIFTEKTTVYIDIVEKEKSKIYIVEYDYEIFIDD